MDVLLIESNPLVEETRHQIAVKRGPIVYCIESPDLPGSRIFDVIIPSTIQMQPLEIEINGAQLMALEGTALIQKSNNWNGRLYRSLSNLNALEDLRIQLIPYFAWGNRGKSEMSVWMPLNK